MSAARERQGLTREQLAVRAELSWSAIAQIETGRRTNLRPATLAALARSLAVTVDYLVGHAKPGGLFEHRALIYGSDDEFAATAGPFLEAAAERDEPALAVTTPKNIRALRQQLGPAAKRVRFEKASEWYREPAAALSGYRDFANDSLGKGALWLWVLGEPVWPKGSAADTELWNRYESLLNLAFADFPLTAVCPYDASTLDPAIAEQASRTHCEQLGVDGVHANPDYVDPAEYVLRRS